MPAPAWVDKIIKKRGLNELEPVLEDKATLESDPSAKQEPDTLCQSVLENKFFQDRLQLIKCNKGSAQVEGFMR